MGKVLYFLNIHFLELSYAKCGPGTCTSVIMWEPVKSADLETHLGPAKLDLHVHKMARESVCSTDV